MINKLIEKLKDWRASDSSLIVIISKFLYYKLRGKNILACQRTIIKGAKNIDTGSYRLSVGVDYVGFVHKKDWTYLNIQGKFKINGHFSIGKGCRFDIGKNAAVEVDSSLIKPFTKVIIAHKLHIGKGTAISWNCQLLDEDFHQIEYEGRKNNDENGIFIGDNVWIGSYTSIYKGAKIPNGCIVASNSVVKGPFAEENVLIAGNPAKIVKRNVSWK
ncbi:acyltransferase [Viscerimonas tarda]